MPKQRLSLIAAGDGRREILEVRPLEEAYGGFLAENTRRGYVRDWKDFFKVDDIRKVTLQRALAVTSQDVARFRDELLEKGLKPGSISRKLSAVRALFDRLVLQGKVMVNPAHPKLVRAPKRGNVKKMDALTQGELVTFLSVIDRKTERGRRDYALIMTDLHLGLRRSEALKIRTEQFKTAEGKAYIVFRSKGEKERLVWINKDLEVALHEYSRDRGKTAGWLFPGRGKKPLSGDQFWRIVQKYLDAAGIKKRVGTHGLRASFITINIDKGTPLSEIQKTVGHSRPDTTLGYARDLEMIKSRAPQAMEGLSASETEK